MKKQHHLTNEKLRNRFDSQFELVNYAISLAQNIIKSGHQYESTGAHESYANEVLEKIEQGTDLLELMEDDSPSSDPALNGETLVEKPAEEVV